MRSFAPGESIAQLMRHCGLDPLRIPARVFLDDQLIESAYWHLVKPKAGHLVSVRVIPEGGNGQGKDVLRIVAMIGVVALAIAAPWLAGLAGATILSSGVGAALLTAGVGIVGSLAVGALIPPPTPNIPQLGGMNADRSPSLSITGTRNELNLYGVVPRIFGRMRFYPPYGAEPYTEVIGNDQYLRVVFCLGYGPLLLSDFKIGETALDQFTDWEIETRAGYTTDEPLTLYSQDIHEDAMSLPLDRDIGWQTRTSQPDVDELSVDITYPNGLYRISQTGEAIPVIAYIRIDYRLVGSGDAGWEQAGAVGFFEGSEFSIPTNPRTFDAFQFSSWTHGNTKMVRRGLRWKPVHGRGQYEIRMRRTPEDSSYNINLLWDQFNALPSPQQPLFINGMFYRYTIEQLELLEQIQWQTKLAQQQAEELAQTPVTRIVDQGFWTCLRSIKYQAPIRLQGMCQVALRIKATDQLNGVIDTFNCIAESILPTWNGFEWVPVPTRNPASIYRSLFQSSATALQLADSRLNLVQLQDWSEANQTAGRECNMVVDYDTTVYEVAKLVAATGRATVNNLDGKYTIVRDLPQTDPVQIFTPRNSWGFKGAKAFIDIPHALKVGFVNEEKNWTKDELIVYADGYNADGSGGKIAASIFDSLDLVGVTSPTLAYQDGRYHLAQAILRPETYELNCDMENLRCTRGDLVVVTSDVTLWGLGAGRIKTVTVNGGGDATAITVDRPFVMSADLRYAIRYRREDGVQVEREVVAVDGEQYSVSFVAPIDDDLPQVGNLFGYGEVDQVSTRLIVKAIRPRQNLEATLTLLDEAPAIHTSDTEDIPPFDPRITIPIPLRQPLPPIIDEIISDERALIRDPDGSYRSRILIRLHFVSGLTPPSRVEVRYKRRNSTESWSQTASTVEGDADEIELTPVHDLYYYDIMLRTVSRYNIPSPWVTVTNYQVVSRALPPPDVSTLTIQDNRLSWVYPSPPADMLGFVVRVQIGDRTSWSDAIPLHDGIVSESHFQIPADSGERTYLVKAVDTSHIESNAAASLYVDWGNRLVANVVETIDYKALGWPGDIVGGAIVLDNLEANAGAPWWTSDAAPFWTNNSAAFWGASSEEMTYTFFYTPPEHLLTGALYIETTVA